MTSIVHLFNISELTRIVADYCSISDIARLCRVNTSLNEAISQDESYWGSNLETYFTEQLIHSIDRSTLQPSNSCQSKQVFSVLSSRTLVAVINVAGKISVGDLSLKNKTKEKTNIDISAKITCPLVPFAQDIKSVLPNTEDRSKVVSGIVFDFVAKPGKTERQLLALTKALKLYTYLFYQSKGSDLFLDLSNYSESQFLVREVTNETDVADARDYAMKKIKELGLFGDNEVVEEDSDEMMNLMVECLIDKLRIDQTDLFGEWLLDKFDLESYKDTTNNESSFLGTHTELNGNNIRVTILLNDKTGTDPVKKLISRKFSKSWGRVSKPIQTYSYTGFLLYPVAKYFKKLDKMLTDPEKYKSYPTQKRSMKVKWRTFAKELHTGTLDFVGQRTVSEHLYWLNSTAFWPISKHLAGLKQIAIFNASGSQVVFKLDHLYPFVEHCILYGQMFSHSKASTAGGESNELIQELYAERLRDIEEEEANAENTSKTDKSGYLLL